MRAFRKCRDYGLAVGCLLIGIAVGWLARGSDEEAVSKQEKITVPSTRIHTDSNRTAPPPASNPVRPAAAYGHTDWESLPLKQRLDKGFAIRDRFQRFANFASTVATLTDPADFETVAQAIKAADRRGLQFDHEWEHLLQQWGRTLGLAAIETVQAKYADPKEPTWSLKKLLGGWAEADPSAATAWLNAHTDTKDWDGQLLEVLNGISRQSLDTGTRAALDSLPAGNAWLHRATMSNLAEMAVREGGLERLHSWYQSLPRDAAGESARTAAFPAVYQRIKHADAESARRFAEENARQQRTP